MNIKKLIALIVIVAAPTVAFAARTQSSWLFDSTGYIFPAQAPVDVLISGTNRYLNFGTFSGSSGYGFRDSSGTMQFKNSGGSWTAFGSGGGGGGGAGTFGTTTSNVSGELINYPLNDTDIVCIGSNATSTCEFYFDPNIPFSFLSGITQLAGGFLSNASSTQTGPFRLSSLSQGGLYIGSTGLVNSVSTSTPTASTGLSYSGTFGSMFGGSSGNLTVNTSQNITTLSNLTTNGVVYTAGGGGVLNTKATSTPTVTSPITYSGTIGDFIGGVSGAFACATCAVTGTTIAVSGTANQITSSAGAQDLSTNRTWTLSIPSQFNIQQASTTLFSSFGGAYIGSVGGNATTTIFGTATSTFGAGIAGTALNITGNSTSTFANGIDLYGGTGCFAINHVCISGSGGGSGTVTSVALSDAASTLTIGGTPITTSGTLTATLNLAHANTWTALQSFFANASTTGLSGNYAQFGSSATTTITAAGEVGINTLTPGGWLDVNNKLTVSKTGFGTTTVTGFTVNGSATSTSNVGFNLTAGCFAISGTCISGSGGGSGTVTSVTLATPSSTLTLGGTNPVTTSGTINADLNLGHANSWTALQQFANASTSLFSSYGPSYFGATATSSFSTAGALTLITPLLVPSGGTGVGTFTSNGVLYGNGTGNLSVTAQGAANTVLTANAGAPAFSAAPTIGTSVTTPLFLASSGGSVSAPSHTWSTDTNTGMWSPGADTVSFAVGGVEPIRFLSTGQTVVGTTTQSNGAVLTSASSTQPQFALSAGAGIPQWAMRNDTANRFTLSTTTVTGTSTSTPPALTIVGAAGTSGMYIATGTPGVQGATGLEVAGTIFFHSISTDAGGTDNTLCLKTTKEVTTGTGTLGICLGTSSKLFKHDITDLQPGLDEILALQPRSFYYNKGYGDSGIKKNYGFIAEEMNNVLPELVGKDAKGNPTTADYLGLVPVLTKAVQQLATQGVKVKRTFEEDWQTFGLILAFLLIGFQQWQIKKLRK